MSLANENILREYNIKIISEFGVSPVTIEHFNNLYDIYSDGRVWTHKKKKFLPCSDNGKGYLSVNLYNSVERNSRRMYIHRLVALCFIENTEKLDDVNHIDFNKGNNIVSNLEWTSRLDNMQHAWTGGRFSERCNKESAIRDNWIGKVSGNRKITALVDKQAKAGNYYVQVTCLLCGNENIVMAQNDFLKNKSKCCSNCRNNNSFK